MKTHEMAFKLLELIESRGTSEPIHGYAVAAEMIGRRDGNKVARTMGQVTSLLDYACFVAGLPMLAFHCVKNVNGEVPENSFAGVWSKFKPEVESISANFQWTQPHFDKLRKTLVGLDARAAKSLWNAAEARGEQFIRYNLHRQVPN